MKMKVKTLIAISTLVLVVLILISCAHEEGYTHTEATTPISDPENIDDCESEEIEMESTEYLESEEIEMENVEYPESEEMEMENSEHSESDASNQEEEEENDDNIEQEQNLITRSECIVLLENPIDLRLILWQDFDEANHLFGKEVVSYSEHIFDYLYNYEVGLMLGVITDSNDIKRIHFTFIDFSQTHNCTCVHLSGIDGISTRDDVVALFGDSPHNTRSSPDEERVGAVISYGYWIEEHRFAWFYFDNNGRVVAISYFMAGS